jgi:hypothetical protein
MVNKVVEMAYLYKGQSWSIRFLYVLRVLKTVIDNKVIFMSYLY